METPKTLWTSTKNHKRGDSNWK